MKNVLLSFLLLIVCFCTNAQTIVYKTYENFEKNEGEKMEEDFYKTREGTFGHSVKFKDANGKVTKYSPKDLWGFLYKGHLFRSVKGELAMLQDTGTINFWLNGFASLSLLADSTRKQGYYFESESQCYLSSGDINAKLYRMPVSILVMRDWKEFKKDFPDYDDFVECTPFSQPHWSDNYIKIRECVKEFNTAEIKRKSKKKK